MHENRSAPQFLQIGSLLLSGMLCASLQARPASGHPPKSRDDNNSDRSSPFALIYLRSPNDETSETNSPIIPVGTILPVRLNATISSKKSKSGEEVKGRIMQDIPLGPGRKIPAGSKVTGRIVEVVPASSGQEARVALLFDKVILRHQAMAITTNLRAVAGFMAVLDAQTPPIGPSESDVYDWLTTVQIGGDVVYGKGGIVTAADNPNLIVGKEMHGGVLGKVTAKEGTACRGAIDGNDQPQALWVFSTSACGTYGLGHIAIAYAGRTDPDGVIVLTSDRGDLKIAAGAGLLLRVIEASKGNEEK